MAIEKVVNINVTLKGSSQAIASTTKLNSKLTELNQKTGVLGHGFKGAGNEILDAAAKSEFLNTTTSGLSTTIADAAGNAGLFSKGITVLSGVQKVYTLVIGSTTGALKALRVALLATGLGAIVVLLGLFIAKMNESAEATENEKSATDALNKSLQAMSDLYKENLQSIQDVTKERVLRAKIAGKSEADIQKIERESAEERFRIYKEEDARIQREKANKKLTAEQAEKLREEELANQRAYFKFLNDEKIKDLESDLSAKEAKDASDKALQEKLLENKRKADEEKRKLEEEYQKSLQEGLNSLQIATNEAEFEQRRLDIENRQAQADEIVKIAEKQYQEEAEAQRKTLLFTEIVEQSKVDLANNTVNLLGQLAKKGSAVAKGLAIANVIRGQVESVSKIISSTAEANAKAAALSPLTGGQPFVTINTVSAGLGIASSVAGAIKAIKDINSESKSASGGSVSSSGGGAAPSAPSFNLVSGSGSNQIAEGLANQRRPLQAYVVSGAVTSAQSLDRNIINDASI